jgi:hypothetical protein
MAEASANELVEQQALVRRLSDETLAFSWVGATDEKLEASLGAERRAETKELV